MIRDEIRMRLSWRRAVSSLLRPGPVAGAGSKLGELIGKLHEYMESATEGKDEPTLPGHWNGKHGMQYK